MKPLLGILLFCLALCGPLGSHATPQITDRLVVGRDTVRLNSMLLTVWLEGDGNAEKLGLNQSVTSSACWRGYQATWLLENGKLYLTGIAPCPNPENTTADLKTIFGDQCIDGRVFADWVSEEVHYSWGEIVMKGMVPVAKFNTYVIVEKGCEKSEMTYLNFEEIPGQINVWASDIREKLAALIAEKIRWAKLGTQKEDPRIVRAMLEISPKGRCVVSGRDVPKQYAAELTRIFKGLRWNMLRERGETLEAGVYLPLRFDFKNHTVEPMPY